MILLLLLLFLEVTHGNIDLVGVKSTIKPISIPALGRPFALGDLYDRRRDFIIPGPKIWSNEELAEYSQIKTYGTKFEVSTALNVNEGLSKFDIKASMKMSFLSGMVSVSGSASYIQDKVSKNSEARVALKYSSTTFKRTMLPKTFTKATYISVLKSVSDATDVVAAIQYGAGAVFVFDRTIQSNEDKRVIEGMLQVSVKKIPSFSIEGSGRVNISEEDKKLTENFTCRFHGDFVLKEHPGNYEEAIVVYKNLPSLLGENYENSVPVKVWLYPIEMLPLGKSPISLYDIQENLITSVADEIEAMENCVRQANEILDTFVADHHPRIRQNVIEFNQYMSLYMMDFKQKLANLLPKIRDGTKDCHSLVGLIDEKQKTPFSMKSLDTWITLYLEEVYVLKSISDLPNYCKDDGDFSSTLLNDKQFTISLTLKLNTRDDNQLQSMKKYLQGGETSTENNSHTVWWRPGQKTLSDLQKYSAIIKRYNDIENKKIVNGIKSNTQFVVREQLLHSDKEKVEIIIDLYGNGKLLHQNVEIPDTVNNVVIVSTSYNSVKLKWDPPSEGANNVDHYNAVAYVPKSTQNNSRNCDEFYCKVLSVTTKDNSVEVVGLEAYAYYLFSLETFSFLGKSAESYKTNMVQTPKCPPGMAHTDEHHCKACEPGKYTEKYGSINCLLCSTGRYSDTYKSSTCTKCPAGTYNDKTGENRNGCVECPVGTYSVDVGASAYWTCKGCPAGTYNSKRGKTSLDHCLKCPKGSYSSNIGTMYCQLCPFGAKTDHDGSVSATACKRGTDVMGKVEKSISVLQTSADANVRNAQIHTNALKTKTNSLLSVIKQTSTSKLIKIINSITYLHNSIMYFHNSITYLHNSITCVHNSITYFYNLITYVHNSITYFHNSITYLHNLISQEFRKASLSIGHLLDICCTHARMRTLTCTRTRTHIYIHTHTHTHMHMHMHMNMHMHMHTHAHTHTDLQTHMCTPTHTHTHTDLQMHMRTPTYTHTDLQTHMQTQTQTRTHMHMHAHVHTRTLNSQSLQKF